MSKSEFVVYNACKDMVKTVEALASKIGVDTVKGSIMSERNGDVFLSFESTLNGNTKYAMHRLDVYELILLSPEKLQAYMDDNAGRMVNVIYNQHHNDNKIPQTEEEYEQKTKWS